jgi:hypothetical protein
MRFQASAAATDSSFRRTRVLDPTERTAEVLFGLIMVLTFTGSLSVAQAGRDDVRAMLIGALGCNIAWGVIDAVLYLMACLGERGYNLSVYRAARATLDPERGRLVIAATLPPVVASVLEPSALEHVRQRLLALPAAPARARLRGEDWRGAVAVFLLVCLSTLPVVVPFVFVPDATRALRMSNAIAVVMLCGAGITYGRHAGQSPWLLGVSMVLLGCVLVALTIALGG